MLFIMISRGVVPICSSSLAPKSSLLTMFIHGYQIYLFIFYAGVPTTIEYHKLILDIEVNS